jgi:hypothetical protein
MEPFRTWYYPISPNSHTLLILLQIDPIFGDECETVCEGCHETEDTSIFAWFSIPSLSCTIRFVDYLLIARWTT